MYFSEVGKSLLKRKNNISKDMDVRLNGLFAELCEWLHIVRLKGVCSWEGEGCEDIKQK